MLSTVDFSAVTFDVIVIEVGENPSESELDEACKRLLQQHGYHMTERVGIDMCFVYELFTPPAMPK